MSIYDWIIVIGVWLLIPGMYALQHLVDACFHTSEERERLKQLRKGDS